MNAKQYVNAIVENIKCNPAKKKEIEKQLLQDINVRLEQGEQMKDIISQMGTAKEIADGFNENMSAEEKKIYSRNKVLKITGLIALVLALLIFSLYWVLPKNYDIGKSRYFERAEVEAAMKETIELLDAGDYNTLHENAVPIMKSTLNAETMENVKSQISDNWGELERYDSVYIVETVQRNTHYAVCVVTVTYENVSVTYTLSFDKDMKLAGLYIR